MISGSDRAGATSSRSGVAFGFKHPLEAGISRISLHPPSSARLCCRRYIPFTACPNPLNPPDPRIIGLSKRRELGIGVLVWQVLKNIVNKISGYEEYDVYEEGLSLGTIKPPTKRPWVSA